MGGRQPARTSEPLSTDDSRSPDRPRGPTSRLTRHAAHGDTRVLESRMRGASGTDSGRCPIRRGRGHNAPPTIALRAADSHRARPSTRPTRTEPASSEHVPSCSQVGFSLGSGITVRAKADGVRPAGTRMAVCCVRSRRPKPRLGLVHRPLYPRRLLRSIGSCSGQNAARCRPL